MQAHSFREFLRGQIQQRRPVIFDGGMGTMIQRIPGLSYSIPEDLNFYSPEAVKEIHRSYIRSGCNVCTANTFGATSIKLEGEHRSAEEYIKKGIQLALEAIQECREEGITRQCFAAWDTSQNGKLLEPAGSLTFDQAYESYRAASIAAESAGADLAVVETMSDLYEAKAAVLAIKENTRLPVIVSMTFQPNLRTLTGADVLTCVTYLESLRADAIGCNCGGSLEEDMQLVQQFCQYASLPVLVQPNAGMPSVENGKTVFKSAPKEFAQMQLKAFKTGAAILGGCCGTTPAHIQEMVQTVKNEIPEQQERTEESSGTFVCSYNKTVRIGGSAGPVIVGERINPTGKKKCREALQSRNMQFFISEADSQIASGAHILDINTGLPGIDEAELMLRVMKEIQAAFTVPLQIDSSEPAVLERALRYYNGKALVNSVNGKQESMDAVFPLIQRYGGSVVALCIDENGISPSAEGRACVARKIISEAAKYGIQPKDIFIDTLTLAASSSQKSCLETIRAIRIIKEEFGSRGIQFALGVSNSSFGLPRREIISSRFFMLALDAGLSAAIINPASDAMMDTYRAYRALSGYDENCLGFIQSYTGTHDPASGLQKNQSMAEKDSSEKTAGSERISHADSSIQEKTEAEPQEDSRQKALIQIIEKGFKDQAEQATQSLLDIMKPVQIIDSCIVPALDAVGKDFESGRKFLPQLLLSAETVSKSFSKIKETLAASGTEETPKGTIVIATVFGDIHDIGKNIVKAMLENYGYKVIDLGKNVPAEIIIKAVIENNVRLVGLSALMTTTVANMEETIRKLRLALAEHGRECKVVAGGAVLTEDYAKKIGADYYAKDAMATVAAAKEVFGK